MKSDYHLIVLLWMPFLSSKISSAIFNDIVLIFL